MSLRQKIDKDMIDAQKSGDKLKLGVIRMLRSEIKYKEIEKKTELEEEEVISVLSSAAKKRRESIEEFSKGNRTDLVEKETKELEIIRQYLPQQMAADEVSQLIEQAVAETGASSMTDKGKVMAALMPKIKGRFDGKEANLLVSQRLSRESSQG